MTIKSDIYSMAKKHGYEGMEPRTTTEAINVLADMLAGEDIDSGRTIAEAVRSLAPYVGWGAPEYGPLMPVYSSTEAHQVLLLKEMPGESIENDNTYAVLGPNGTGFLPFTVPNSGTSTGSSSGAYVFGQHVIVCLDYGINSDSTITVKTLAGEDWPHEVIHEDGSRLFHVAFMTPWVGKDANAPLIVTIA